jgi:hypothetical protein
VFDAAYDPLAVYDLYALLTFGPLSIRVFCDVAHNNRPDHRKVFAYAGDLFFIELVDHRRVTACDDVYIGATNGAAPLIKRLPRHTKLFKKGVSHAPFLHEGIAYCKHICVCLLSSETQAHNGRHELQLLSKAFFAVRIQPQPYIFAAALPDKSYFPVATHQS